MSNVPTWAVAALASLAAASCSGGDGLRPVDASTDGGIFDLGTADHPTEASAS